jgi:hypothetical protein
VFGSGFAVSCGPWPLYVHVFLCVIIGVGTRVFFVVCCPWPCRYTCVLIVVSTRVFFVL